MTFQIALSALLLSVAGCATAPVSYDEPGVAQAERQRDQNECLRAAISTDERARIPTVFQIDREAYVDVWKHAAILLDGGEGR